MRERSRMMSSPPSGEYFWLIESNEMNISIDSFHLYLMADRFLRRLWRCIVVDRLKINWKNSDDTMTARTCVCVNFSWSYLLCTDQVWVDCDCTTVIMLGDLLERKLPFVEVPAHIWIVLRCHKCMFFSTHRARMNNGIFMTSLEIWITYELQRPESTMQCIALLLCFTSSQGWFSRYDHSSWSTTLLIAENPLKGNTNIRAKPLKIDHL